MRVVDGMHRLLAALLNGRQTIEAELFDGTADEGFLRAVRENVVHGLPLSQADRRAAAARIIDRSRSSSATTCGTAARAEISRACPA